MFLSLSFVFFFVFFFVFVFFFFNKCFAAGMTTKFNQGMYAKMRGKKNEPLSSIGKRTVQVVEKGISITPPVTVAEPLRTASPATSVKEINPIRKRPRVEDKENDKADSLLSSVFTMLALHCWGHRCLSSTLLIYFYFFTLICHLLMTLSICIVYS